jgi:hypothetical protein
MPRHHHHPAGARARVLLALVLAAGAPAAARGAEVFLAAHPHPDRPCRGATPGDVSIRCRQAVDVVRVTGGTVVLEDLRIVAGMDNPAAIHIAADAAGRGEAATLCGASSSRGAGPASCSMARAGMSSTR